MSIIVPEWPAPANVRSIITTRNGGHSGAVYDSFNLASHVADVHESVTQNRVLLRTLLAEHTDTVPEFQWLEQTHSTMIARLPDNKAVNPIADGAYTQEAHVACSVLTADCLPVLICDQSGSEVAAIHAGWRGLANGILSASLKCFTAPVEQLLVYLGPAISQPHFEVGEEVLLQFQASAKCRAYAEPVVSSFKRISKTHTGDAVKFHADIFRLAKSELNAAGVSRIYGGNQCSYRDDHLFYSYRRQGVCGRFATTIWLLEK